MALSGIAVVLSDDDVPGARLTSDPSDCSVTELKRWLECHGGKRTGRKSELVARVQGLLAVKAKVDSKVDGGRWYDLKISGKLSSPPQPSSAKTSDLPEQGWRAFPSRNLPSNFNYGHVYHYLVESIAGNPFLQYDEDEDEEEDEHEANPTTAKPLKKGRNLLKSKFVSNVEDNDIEQEYFVRGHVHHSMRKEVPLQVTATISKDSGYIKDACCSCKANAMGRCAHVAAVLLLVSDYASESGTVVAVPSTSLSCSWGKGKKRDKNPKALHNTEYSSRSAKRAKANKLLEFDPRPASARDQAPCRAGLARFVVSLQGESAATNTVSMWESLLKIPYDDFVVDQASDDMGTLNTQVNQFVQQLQMQCDMLCGSSTSALVPDTEDQSECAEWYNQRWGRITASRCKEITTLGDGILSPEADGWKQRLYHYINDNFWHKDSHVLTADMAYGVAEESAARSIYQETTGNAVVATGLWINKSYPHLGASPDGVIVVNGEISGIVEIKCLKVLRLNSVDHVVSQMQNPDVDRDIKKVLGRQCFKCSYGKLVLKEKHIYYFQVQMQLLVTGFAFCDFVLHSKKGKPAIQRIFPDPQVQQHIAVASRAFWRQVLIPEYFLMKVPRRLLPIIVSQSSAGFSDDCVPCADGPSV